MAVDTRQKRHSLIGYGLAFRLTLPTSDGTLDVGDRQHLAGLYSGIEAASPPVVELYPASTFQARHRGTRFSVDASGTIFKAARRGTTFTIQDGRP